MNCLRVSLAIFSVIIVMVSLSSVNTDGFNWPRVFFGDLADLNWRAQFNTDLLIHLILLGAWVAWREGLNALGIVFGIFCVAWGGLFSFPYLLHATYRAKGDVKAVLLGVHAGNGRANV